MQAKSVPEILVEELSILQSQVIRRHEAANQVATGTTRASFGIALHDIYHGQFTGANYSGVLERGRKPGKVPYRFWEIIEKWAIAKGLVFDTDQQRKQFAWFVAKKIQAEGTALFRSGIRQDIFDTPIADFETRLTNRIANFYTSEIENQIFNFK